MFFINLFAAFLVVLFILNLPVVYKIITQEIDLDIETIDYGLHRALTDREVICLADNIFFEAGNQSDLGKKAVAYVTLNRLSSTKFPDNVCSIVYAKKYNVCQFSWVCKHASLRKRKQKEPDMWQRSLSVAHSVIHSYNWKDDPTRGALHFHADYVNPYWSKVLIKTVTIDNHIFYRPRHGT